VTFVNTGSVGKPKDRDPRACYVLAEADPSGGWSVEHVQVEYDVGRTVEAIHESELPDEFAEQLKAGGKPEPSKVG
jgi:diadenosine tetraphosphatase ApaH/serine/threonine PP2A family protein phosphatase